jgi:phosphatidylglycerol lysyltransferase
MEVDRLGVANTLECFSGQLEMERQESIENPSEIQLVRTLVLRYGWNSTAYQILNPGISHWFSASGDAVIGFVRHCGVRIVAGAPVCARERLIDVVAEFEQASATTNCRVCYFCAESRLETTLQNSAQHSMVLLGAQPTWHPLQWPAIFQRHASLRAQLKRARNKAVTVSEWPAERASREPALLCCLREWLATRSFPTLHFLVEPMTLERLYDRRVFVAERGGEVIGFCVASPVPLRKGWLIEQIIRGRNAVNGTSEMMIDATVRSMAESGSEFMTLGLSPLSRRVSVQPMSNPLWVRMALNWVRAHGRRFYNFDGLDAFKAKFQPEKWEPVFAISNEARFSPLTLYAIASAFTQSSPIKAISHAILKALMTEYGWLTGRLRRN